MTTATDKEVLGDWSNLKGTRYHLTYALWLLLKRRAKDIRFFAGNDLTATPIPPPKDADQTATVPAVAASSDLDTDIWIQLKATRDPWTVTELLGENLLFNFICNAATSERNGRRWMVVLVTEAEVRGEELRAFLASPSTKPVLEQKFREIVARAEKHLRDHGFSLPLAGVERIAMTALGMLAGTDAVHLATLKAESETELALAIPDRVSSLRVASTLIGALLLDAGHGPTGHIYDIDWLNREAGTQILSDKPFDVDVPTACDQAVLAATELLGASTFRSERCVPRDRLARALNQFLSTHESLFVLVGRSGAGKSWSVADWVRKELNGKTRLFIPGHEFRPEADLGSLAAQQLGRLSSRDWPSRAMMDKLQAVAATAGRGPLLFVIDDLRVTAERAESYREALARLVREARRWNTKLLITCQAEQWELFGLHQQIPHTELFAGQDVLHGDVGGNRQVSFVLEQFTPDELENAVGRRVPADRLTQTLNHLRHPSFSRLRSPFLLNHYLEQVGPSLIGLGRPPEPVDTDRLLGTAVERKLDEVSIALQTDIDSVRAALVATVDLLWSRRREETLSPLVVQCLAGALSGLERSALTALRRAGLLTTSGPISWSEGMVADHLHASRFVDLLERGQVRLEDLDPELDGTVVESVVRVSANGPDLADRLLGIDRRHRPSIARGLAARSAEDTRAALALCALVRPSGDDIADAAGCEALGTIAARASRSPASRTAWRHVVTLYLSGDPHESLRGARALGAAFGYIPRRVARIVRLRIAREPSQQGRRRREAGRALKDALLPVLGVTHREAADVALDLLEQIRPRVDGLPGEDSEQVIPVCDGIRGQAALFHGGASIDRLVGEMAAPNRETRLRAADAIRTIVFEIPDRMARPVCDQLAVEADPDVALRLLWACYPLLSVAPDTWLTAFAASPVSRWDHPIPAGPALSMLGALAEQRPTEVSRLLPRSLGTLPPWAQACLSQVHALAWWECASRLPAEYETLAALADPQARRVPRTFRVFAVRGAFIARLGVAAHGRLTPEGMSVSMMTHRDGLMPYCYTDTEEYIERHAQDIATFADADSLLQLLRDCVRAEEAVRLPSIGYHSLTNAAFSCARDALEDLCAIACRRPDPLSEIRELPRNWQAIRAARHLLERGVHSADVIAFAQAACDEHANGGSMNAWHERGACLAELARHRGTPSETIVAPEGVRGLAAMWLGLGESDNHAQRVARVIDDTPEQMLSLLDLAIPGPDAIPGLFHWSKLSRTWRTTALSGVYRRMFSSRPIGRLEALRLVGIVLAVVRSLPESSERAEHEAVYSAIQSWLEGHPVKVPVQANLQSSPIRMSHSLASELLNRAFEAVQAGERLDSRAVFMDKRFWWQSHSLHIENDVLAIGSGLSIYLIAILPALRLAGVAVGRAFGMSDPAGAIMAGRYEVLRELSALDKKYWHRETKRERLEQQLGEVRRLAARFPGNERVGQLVGNLEVRLGLFADAERSLHECLAHALCSRPTRAGVLYDLACIAARTGRPDECRTHLTACLATDSRCREDIGKDADFESVKETEWFKQMEQGNSDRSDVGTGQHVPTSSATAARADGGENATQ